MIIHQGYDNLDFRKPVVTLGIFDGVHRGHRMLLDKLVSAAKEVNGESVVITFHPHPRIVLENDHHNLSFLTTMEEKINLLRSVDVDHLIIIEFNREFSELRACDFIREILTKKIRTRHLIIGYDHHFGRKGEGDFNTLKQCPDLIDFKIEQIQGLETGEGTISSSNIREALLNGRLDEANSLLGYNYSLTGTVISGKHLGRSLGFPTANIKADDDYKLIPANGVYAVNVIIDENFCMGMLSIGTNPTVNPDRSSRSIEVHILNFDNDIYGRKITIRCRKRLRDEKKFDNVGQLTEQMEIDKLDTIGLLT